VTNHPTLAIGHDPSQPTTLWNHNHSFNDWLRCRCGKTWMDQVREPTLCKADSRGENKRSRPARGGKG
jgi:hypothetical protein